MRTTYILVAFFIVKLASARLFHIHNNLDYQIYVGILANDGFQTPENGGFALDSQQQRDVEVPSEWAGRVWARTGCNFDAGVKCETGDCGGLECNGKSGETPATLVEIKFNGDGNQDFYDVSLVDGFNVPASITPVGQQGEGRHCTTAECLANLNPDCPAELQKISGDNIVGCISSCVLTNSEEDCCTGAHNTVGSCSGGQSVAYFHSTCPKAYSYAFDDGTSIFTCDTGDYPYDITFG